MLTVNCYLHVCVSKDSLKQVSQSTERYDRPRQWLGVEIAKFNCAQNVTINYTSEPSALFRRTKNWITLRKLYADIRAMNWQDLFIRLFHSSIHWPCYRGPCSCTQLTHSRVLLLIQWFFLSLSSFVRRYFLPLWVPLRPNVGTFHTFV